MTRNLAGLAGILALLVVELHAVAPADACGEKLTIRSMAPRKVARTSRPSRVLLLGSSARSLERDLAAAGHKVDTAPNTQSARDGQYAVVLVDSNAHASAARERFGGATIVVRSGDHRADMRTVEDRVARKPVQAGVDRGVVNAREVRTPVAVGPVKAERRVVAVREPSELPPVAAAPPAPAPSAPVEAPTPVAVTTTVPTPAETPRVERPASTRAELHQEIYFGRNSSSVRNTAALAKAKQWLDANPGVTAVVAGHADPTGTPEGNLALSQTRAESVRDALVGMGVERSRLEVQAHGDTQLRYDARDGRNRRVAIDAKR